MLVQEPAVSDAYEPWALKIRSTYERRESATFVLHDNIADIFPLPARVSGAGAGSAAQPERYVTARAYVEAMLDLRDYIIIGFDVSRGMRFYRDADALEFVRLANLGRPAQQPLVRSVYDFPHEPDKALAYIEAIVTGVEDTSRPVAVLIDYADQLSPNARGGHLSEAERTHAVTLQRFARLFYERLQDNRLRDAVLFLLTPNLHDLHNDIVTSEYVASIGIPRPDASLRGKYIAAMQSELSSQGRAVVIEDSTERMVAQTAGLTLTGIRHIFLRAAHANPPSLSMADVFERKRELLARDSRGMLEIVPTHHGMEAVGGHATIKEMLASTALDLKRGYADVPVGMVFPGPNGVGKTFIAKAFAKDSGLNCVSLKNFRGMYVGQTESNLELIFSILKSMTPNVVIVDEADKMLGNERGDGGSGVDERVFGALTAFMGDPAYRGKIFWLLLTARPFELAPDTGRPGRVEEHVPILPPMSLQDRRAVLDAVARSRQVALVGAEGHDANRHDADEASAGEHSAGERSASEQTEGFSEEEYELFFEAVGLVTPAAIELIINRARRAARRQQAAESNEASSQEVRVPFRTALSEARNYVPDGTDHKLRLQTLEAVLYTNHLDYLPEPWRERVLSEPAELAKERAQLRLELGYD